MRNAECGINDMRNENLKNRTKKFALEIIRLVETLSWSRTTDIICKQLIRSGTSVGANYRAASQNSTDHLKDGHGRRKSDETMYWMELLTESGALKLNTIESLMKEANELRQSLFLQLRPPEKRSRK